MLTSLSTLLGEIPGVTCVLDTEQCAQYAVDGMVPDVVVSPSTVEGVSRVLSMAQREDKKVTAWGGGTQMSLGNVPKGLDIAMVMSSLDRMVEHQPEDLTATVEAGITLARLQEHLSKTGQFLPCQTPSFEWATIGGILAANVSGPSRLAYGTPRNWLIGTRVANADGTVTRSGGKVVKNVTGFDLNKLYTGSLGTLGVIVEATFKLASLPPVSRTLVATYSSLGRAAAVAQSLLGSSTTPQALVIVNAEVVERLQIEGKEYAVLVLLSGRASSVRRRLELAVMSAREDGCNSLKELSAGDGDLLWQDLMDLGWVGDDLPMVGVRVSLLPSQTVELAQRLDSLNASSGRHALVADMGAGQVRSLWWLVDGVGLAEEAIQKVKGLCEEHGATWVIERCPASVKATMDIWGPPPQAIDIMRRIKKQLDPTNVLNYGRFVGGI